MCTEVVFDDCTRQRWMADEAEYGWLMTDVLVDGIGIEEDWESVGKRIGC